MNPNITLVVQGLAFFAVAWIVMKYGWPHIIAAIEERQAKIAEGLAAADRARQELADADARVADEIRKARSEATAVISRIQRFHRLQIVVQAPTAAIMGKLFAGLRGAPPIRPAVKIAVDIDPVNLL